MKTRKWIVLALLVLLTTVSVARSDPEPFREPVAFNHCFCFSADGKYLAMNYWSVWEIATGKRVLKGQTRGANAMAFSPNGKYLAVGGPLSGLNVFTTKKGELYWNLILTHGMDGIVRVVAFTPDNKYLLSASDNGMLRVWDVEKKTAHALFCIPSSNRWRNGWESYVKDWQKREGDKPPDGVKTFEILPQKVERLTRFCISPDGKYVALATDLSEVYILELSTGKIAKTLRTSLESYSVKFSTDGKRLAIGGGSETRDDGKSSIELWDMATEKCVVTCKGHRQTVLHMAFSPDGKKLASAGVIDGARVWDTTTGKQLFALYQNTKQDERVVGVGFLPNGKVLLTMNEECSPVHFWDAETGKAIKPADLAAKVRP